MKEIDNIILDLDGTVYVDNKIINKSDIEIRRLAKKGKSIYYLTHIDIFCPTLKGNMPDCGAIGMLIEKTTGKKSINNFGKPSDLMTDYINKIVDKDHNKIVVGDRIHTDIELGKKIGAETVLVCTGEYQNAKNDNLKINNTQIYNTLTDYLLTI